MNLPGEWEKISDRNGEVRYESEEFSHSEATGGKRYIIRMTNTSDNQWVAHECFTTPGGIPVKAVPLGQEVETRDEAEEIVHEFIRAKQ